MLLFYLPVVGGNLLQQVYSVSDTIIVGRFVGWQALGAIGGASVLSFAILWFCGSFGQGLSIVTGQRFGANDELGVRRSIATGFVLATTVSIMISLAALSFADPLLRLIKIHDDLFAMAKSYITIIFAGIPATAVYSIVSSQLRALGDSRTPMWFLLLSSLLNIGLDIWFVTSLGLGVKGVAAATTLSQFAVCISSCIYAVVRYPQFRMSRADWKIGQSDVWTHIRLGVPMAFQCELIAVSCVVMQGAVNRLGPVATAAFTTACHVDQLCTTFIYAGSATLCAFAAQNYGAGKFDRIRTGFNQSLLFIVGICVTGGAAIITWYEEIAALYVGKESAAVLIPLIGQFMRIRVPLFSFLGLSFLLRGALQGMNYALVPLISGISDLIVRSGMTVLLGRFFGFGGVCLGDAISWAVSVAVLGVPYLIAMRRHRGK
ncbi:MAG: MATE family efflux transporter [Victivallaceae bacterium]|nr:MATE family efflux transporter [Victivallaceae bacterium]